MLDLVVCVALGVDMFDCVYPSRTARFGTALVRTGTLNLKSSQYMFDYNPIEEDCNCKVCKKYTRACLHSLVKSDQISAQLLTYHNLAFQKRLMDDMRSAIIDGSFPQFVQNFMEKQFPQHDYPIWIVEALNSVKIKLNYGEEQKE